MTNDNDSIGAVKLHPVAGMFPSMPLAEFEALKADVAAQGLLEPVWTFQGQVVDGRHRVRACHDLGIEPAFREFDGDESELMAFVVSLNMTRRHMSQSQRAVVALAVEEQEAVLAQERKGVRTDLGKGLARGGRAAERAATVLGVSSAYIKTAKTLQREAPDLLKKILADHRFGLQDARRELAERRRIQRRQTGAVVDMTCSLPPDGFRAGLVVADPAWQFDDAGIRGAASRHYSCMSLDAIKRLEPWGRPVRVWAAKHAYLGVWVPCSLLPAGLEVVEAWGATYKSCMVWSKERDGRSQLGAGHHVRNCTELLLLGTWGSPRPADKAVPSIIKSPRTTHSTKPDESYELLERLVGCAPKLELFARRRRQGWAAWGDEVEGDAEAAQTPATTGAFV